jgi:hypothetical protein
VSPAAWLFLFFVLLGVLTPVGFIIARNDNEPSQLPDVGGTDRENGTDENETDSGDLDEDQVEETDLESILGKEGEEETQSTDSEATEPEETDQPESSKEDVLPSEEESEEFTSVFIPLPELKEDPSETNHYNDRNNPDEPSENLRAAVEWLVRANTEAIHEEGKRRTFLGHLRNFIRSPRAEGALTVAETSWRDESPNMSRLIGERFLVMTLGLSAYGNADMDAHKQAFMALLGESWSEDELEAPLLYQAIGRLGLLTPTPTPSLQEELRSRITAQAIRSSDPPAPREAHFHSLIFAASPGEVYPFPRSDKGLSRLWHWDEHNPPLAELDFLPPVLYGLWIHYKTGGDISQAANDFGAMLGTWWDEKEPTADYLDANPRIWRAILLTGWAILADQPIIWDQLSQRYQSLGLENSFLQETTETVLDWVDTYGETGEVPEGAFDRNVQPPVDWVLPMASDLISGHSTPTYEYPENWCNQMTHPEPPVVEDL